MSKRLIHFDWAIKKLLRNKANFVVLEGFLSELLFEDIKIEKILESESNQETYNDKHNRVDMLIQNAKNELVIIEIQNTYEIDYFHRMAYGASKALTENLSAGQLYAEIKKVISINIVYFDLGQGKDYIYKGTTNFEGLHQKDTLELSAQQRQTFTKQNVADIFPEYYLLKVNQFDDVAKDTLDEWIYFLKNSEVRDEFKAKGLAEAKEVLDVMRLNKEQQYGYNRHLDYLRVLASDAYTIKIEQEEQIRQAEKRARQQAEEKIKQAQEEAKQAQEEAKQAQKKGKQIEKIEIAKNAIRKGLDNDFIAELTGLTLAQIEQLRQEK